MKNHNVIIVNCWLTKQKEEEFPESQKYGFRKVSVLTSFAEYTQITVTVFFPKHLSNMRIPCGQLVSSFSTSSSTVLFIQNPPRCPLIPVIL